MIKQIKFLLACALLISLSACGGNDDPEDELIGTWELISFDVTTEAVIETMGDVTTTTSVLTGTDLDYRLTFEASTYSTEGNYSYDITTTLDGDVIGTSTTTNTDVSGNGSYTSTETTITSDGAFFQLEVDGIDINAIQGQVSADYEIESDGSLVFTQDDETTTTVQGISSTSSLVATSRWRKQ